MSAPDTALVCERPIIFSAPMVRAILDGRKTQTRRVVTGKFALEWLAPGMFAPSYVAERENDLCPYGQPGDRLWVRETWARLRFYRDWETGHVDDWEPDDNGTAVYSADEGWEDGGNSVKERGFQWRPSIFMPRDASRITLELTEVRVQRVQDITDDDACAEGMTDEVLRELDMLSHANARDAYSWLWDSLNVKRGYGWESNPWVWALTFTQVTPTVERASA